MRNKALAYVTEKHQGQTYGDKPDSPPYTVHLLAVEAVVTRFFIGHVRIVQLQCIALLHDVVEDTDATAEDVMNLFGIEVAEAVEAVTDEPGANRREKKGKTYPKIRAAGYNAIVVKLADRIANWEQSLSTGDSRYWMYAKEHWNFYGALYQEGSGPMQDMWDHLDTLREQAEAKGPHRRPRKKH